MNGMSDRRGSRVEEEALVPRENNLGVVRGSDGYHPSAQLSGFDETDWQDAIVLVERGEIEVEHLDGRRHLFERGDVLSFRGLPLRSLHNRGTLRAVLTAVSRREPGC